MKDALYSQMEKIEHRHWWFLAKRRIIRAMIDRYAPPPPEGRRPRLIDIGCGTGGLLDDTADRFDTLGFDSAPQAVEICTKRGHDVKPCWLPDTLPAEPDSADVCVMSDVLEHVDDDAGSVAAAASKLRPGGVLVCTVPAHRWLWTARDDAHEHKRRYSKPEYSRLFEIPTLRREFIGWYMAWLMPLLVAERLARKITGNQETDDLTIPAPPINTALRMVFASERFTLGRVPFPIGASLISVHRRVEPAPAQTA